MGKFLNSSTPYDEYKKVRNSQNYIDKSKLIGELIPSLGRKNKHYCITRPPYFGKTVMANMVSAFFGKAQDAAELFAGLAVSKTKEYTYHINKHDVIYIDFSIVPRDCKSYSQYIKRIQDGMNQDMIEAYPNLQIDISDSVWDILQKVFEETRNKFIFVIDEWDSVFHMPFISSEEQKDYLMFLKNLLKDQVYVELAYMTGVLPIAKYSSGSELNMFMEYDMVTTKRFSEYFGFLDYEVDNLFERYQKEMIEPEISREDLRDWYGGYYTVLGKRLYNPRSIICALEEKRIAEYSTRTIYFDRIFSYIKKNIKDIRDDLDMLIAGEGIQVEIQNYAAVSMQLETRDEIYSAMVVYGLLTYQDGKIYIPNIENMEFFKGILKSIRNIPT